MGSVTSEAPVREPEALSQAKAHIQAARFDDAEALLVRFLQDAPQDLSAVEPLYALAVARRYRKAHASALQALEALIAIKPDYGRAWQERGHTLTAMHRPNDALAAYTAAVEHNPGLIASWRAIAGLHSEHGRADAARLAQGQVQYLESLPAELRNVIDLTHEGKLFKAEGLCREFLQQHKRHVEGMRLLAQIAVRLRVYDDAEFLLESCVEFAPDDVRARMDYVGILNRKGKFQQARREAELLCGLQPDNPAAQLALAQALTGLGSLDEGIAIYKRCLERSSNPAGIHVLIGHAQKALGQTQAAIASYREAFGLRPEYGDAFWSLANTKTYRFEPGEIEQMRRAEAADAIAPDDRIHLCFALGKALEDRGEYDESFAYYERGNELKRARSGYDPDKTEQLVRRMIETCSPELFERHENAGLKCPDPIFIVGLPRAGSTLLEQILASHSLVDGTMELHNILGLAQRLGGRSMEQSSDYPGILADLEPSYFARFGEQFIENTRAYRGEAPFLIDKMPNNFLHIGLIRLILPEAKVIDARRHPMACCFSGFKQLFGEGQDFTYGLDSIGRYYRDYVRLMDHWDEVLPGFVLRVNHEDVVDDLESQVRRILDFCGLPFEAQCLSFYETRRSVRTPSSEQVRQPIYRSGLDQWRNYERHLGPLRSALGATLVAQYSDESVERGVGAAD